MTKKQRKRLKEQQKIAGGFENVIDFAEPKQPDGEDFFVFSIISDDPNHPTWDQRQTCLGSWECCRRTISILVNAWADSKPRTQIRIVWYQGDTARSYFAETLRQERRFLDERKGVVNN